MTRNDLESDGVPDHEGPLASKVATGDPQEGLDAGSRERRPASFDFGITAAEQREGEGLDGRIARELPDPAMDPYAEEPVQAVGVGSAEAGRLIEDDEGAHTDVTAESIAYSAGEDSGDLSAEEAAVHLVSEDLAGLTDDPDGYTNSALTEIDLTDPTFAGTPEQRN